ncbi:coproporphyrinogen III oxidase [Pseudomonas sp. NFXW11]|uniref:coproporphyrinogen III oxidase n=1 Tax=Pseudomonas sp. NFXW11 TaxID=2819531 RepID=UPI003CF007A9
MFDVIHSRSGRGLQPDPGGLDGDCHVEESRFHAGVGSLDVLRALRASRQQPRPLALNLQLPALLATAGQPLEAYLAALYREIRLVTCHLGNVPRVEQFHLAGGHLDPDHLQRLMSLLRKRFNFLAHDSGDYSVDIDLPGADWASMGRLRDLGFNHVSIGVSDSGCQGLSACYQDPGPIQSLLDAARTFGYRKVSVDLGYGHAWQTPDSFAQKLCSLVELEPDRLQVFDYALPPRRYAQGPRQAPSSPRDKALMRRLCFERLPQAGYLHIGLGLFVRADDDLAMAQERGSLSRNYQGFTRHGYCDQIGLGLGAVSRFDGLHAQNSPVLEEYLEQLQQGQLATWRGWRCAAGAQVRQQVVERLACDLELDVRAIERRHGLIFQQFFPGAWRGLEAMSRAGLVELREDFISILPAGRLEVDVICQLFEQQAPAPACALDWRDHDSR